MTTAVFDDSRRRAHQQVHAQFKSESGPVPKRVLKAKNISSKTANSYKFDFAPRGKPDAVENISVAEYYFRTYGIRLKFPNMPLLTSGGGKREIAVPIELFSIIPGAQCLHFFFFFPFSFVFFCLECA